MSRERKQGDAAEAREGTESRQLLLNAAIQLFAEQGFNGTSVRDIASKAELNVSLVSYYFGGKEALYEACLREVGRGFLDSATQLLQPIQTRQELTARLESFVARLFEDHVRAPERHRLLSWEFENHTRSAGTRLLPILMAPLRRIAAFLEAAQKLGLVCTELEPMIMANMLYGITSHFIRVDVVKETQLGRTLKDPVHRQLCVRHSVQIFCDGILQTAP